MFKTGIGAFDGASWEALCQQVFKSKFADDGYQQIPASPGDFGLEGFCSLTGVAFQCYCPNKHYAQAELYQKQRDKIGDDLKKLKAYKDQLEKILKGIQISVWRFVTPEINHNKLLAYVKAKEEEVKSWGLPFIAPDFTIQLQDVDFYILEINQIQAAAGIALDFGVAPAEITQLTALTEEFEENVLRKSRARLASKASSANHEIAVAKLHKVTVDSFLESDGHFRRIEKTAPVLYFKLARLIDEFERRVEEQAATWSGAPEHLTEKLRNELEERLLKLGAEISDATADKISRHMVARWLAVCTLDYD